MLFANDIDINHFSLMSTVELLKSAFVWSEEVCRSRRTLSTLATVSETAPNEQNSRGHRIQKEQHFSLIVTAYREKNMLT